MAFDEVQFPDNISRDARGGSERRTGIQKLAPNGRPDRVAICRHRCCSGAARLFSTTVARFRRRSRGQAEVADALVRNRLQNITSKTITATLITDWMPTWPRVTLPMPK